jgi:hypothetical protein
VKAVLVEVVEVHILRRKFGRGKRCSSAFLSSLVDVNVRYLRQKIRRQFNYGYE